MHTRNGSVALAFFSIFVVIVPQSHAGAESKVFSERTYKHGDAVITLQQTRGRGPELCRANLVVTKDGAETFRIDYSGIDAVGGSYGLFVPDPQPWREYFLVVKAGDYNGRMFVIDRNGETRDLIGGFFFVVERLERTYLFSEYYSDVSGLLVLDLVDGSVIYASAESPSTFEEIPYVHQWYRFADQIFFTPDVYERRWSESTDYQPTRTVHSFDFAEKRLQKMELSSELLEIAERIEYEFNPHDYPDCECAVAEKDVAKE